MKATFSQSGGQRKHHAGLAFVLPMTKLSPGELGEEIVRYARWPRDVREGLKHSIVSINDIEQGIPIDVKAEANSPMFRCVVAPQCR
ncbi:hypothetical protein X740_08015 [Mesorhizobium sp. LNHC221B00]|nr:hypothetical protein X740_08015 [Mesorhizobium sp. LNHC221B00]